MLSILLQLISQGFKTPEETHSRSQARPVETPQKIHQWLGSVASLCFLLIIGQSLYYETQAQRAQHQNTQKPFLTPLGIEGQAIYNRSNCSSCHQASLLHTREIMTGALLAPHFPFAIKAQPKNLKAYLQGQATTLSPLGHRPTYDHLNQITLTGKSSLIKTLQGRDLKDVNEEELIQASTRIAGKTELDALVAYLVETSQAQSQ